MYIFAFYGGWIGVNVFSKDIIGDCAFNTYSNNSNPSVVKIYCKKSVSFNLWVVGSGIKVINSYFASFGID